jgi:4-hydroxy-2-oxoheptanedioate aldolase
MKYTRRDLSRLALSLPFASTALWAQAPKPKRINKAVELWAQGQPVYFDGPHEGIAGSYEQGVKDAQTFLDYISYDMEHAPYDIKGLADYMRGLAAGGPTKSGHRTPAVIVNVPMQGTDETTVRANAWMIQQVLATGVHGVMLCHADTPGAVRAFVEAMRLPIHKQGVDKGLNEGRRGVHGSPTAAKIWGVTTEEYNQKADLWPLNPNGELVLGLKLEDKYALANAEEIVKVPGIGFAEWGPGDMALSFNLPLSDPKVQAAEAQLAKICKAHKIPLMHGYEPKTVIETIKQGYLVGRSGAEAADIGRKYTKRQMPW